LNELVQYHVRVKADTGAGSQFVMREPRLLKAGDRFSWQGHSYRVVSVRFDPARAHMTAITAERAGS
jgi:hypothetical protein